MVICIEITIFNVFCNLNVTFKLQITSEKCNYMYVTKWMKWLKWGALHAQFILWISAVRLIGYWNLPLGVRDTLAQLIPILGLPLFKKIEFLAKYHETLKPITVCLDRLQGQKSCYYGELLPTLFATQTKLEALEARDLRHCLPLLQAVSSQGFPTSSNWNPKQMRQFWQP